jgi:glutamate-1-semialdehyde 2,1-aminomutase
MAAGTATLDAIAERRNAYRQLEARGAQLEEGLKESAKKAGVPVQVNRVGSMMTLFFTEHAVVDYASAKMSNTRRYAKFFHGMLERGVYVAPSQFEAMFISLAHTEQDIARTVEVGAQALQAVANES